MIGLFSVIMLSTSCCDFLCELLAMCILQLCCCCFMRSCRMIQWRCLPLFIGNNNYIGVCLVKWILLLLYVVWVHRIHTFAYYVEPWGAKPRWAVRGMLFTLKAYALMPRNYWQFFTLGVLLRWYHLHLHSLSCKS